MINPSQAFSACPYDFQANKDLILIFRLPFYFNFFSEISNQSLILTVLTHIFSFISIFTIENFFYAHYKNKNQTQYKN